METMPLATQTSSCDTIGSATFYTGLPERLLAPVLEKRFILGETSGRRPGDVPSQFGRTPRAGSRRGCHQYSVRNLRLPSPAATYCLKKHSKYDKGFKGSSHLFCATVLETRGGI